MPRPPAVYYEELGRLAAVASLAEIELGLCGHAAKSGESYTTDWTFADRPMKAVNGADASCHLLDSDQGDELSALIDEFKELVQTRHRAAHSVISIDPALGPDEQWLIESPRDGVIPLIELLESMRQSAAGLHDLVGRADRLRHAIAARKRHAAREGDLQRP